MTGKTSKKQLEYARKYQQQFEDIKVRVAPGERDIFREYAVSHGWKSLNACLKNLMDYAITHGLTAEDYKIR